MSTNLIMVFTGQRLLRQR